MQTAVVKDGKIEETMSQSSVKKAASNSGMDKDAFLQLLVAQMKYQDPLEPTSNTEYISQYATFSQVEQLQNMAATMELTRATSLVGKLVEVETEDNQGNVKTLQGTVEYIAYEAGKAYVSIDGQLYSADDVVAVVDETYQTALDLAAAFMAAMDKLPKVEFLTLDDKGSVEAMQKGFNSMTAYQQSFISDDYIKKLQKYVEQMAKLTEAADKPEEDKKPEDSEDKGDESAGEATEGGDNGDVAKA